MGRGEGRGEERMEEAGKDYILLGPFISQTGGGVGGGAGLDPRVPEGPHSRSSGSPWLLPGMFSPHRTGRGPSKTSTAHTWSGCLPWLGDGEMERGVKGCGAHVDTTRTGSVGPRLPPPADQERWFPAASSLRSDPQRPPSGAGVQAPSVLPADLGIRVPNTVRAQTQEFLEFRTLLPEYLEIRTPRPLLHQKIWAPDS